VLLDRIMDGIFPEAKERAINNGENFAFETNFVADDPLFSMSQFKQAGYETHLIFMGMNTVEECIQRVSLRVKTGGHKVPEESIIYNYKTGYKNLYKYWREFDSITLIDNPIAVDEEYQIPVKLLTFKNEVLSLEDVVFPEWAIKFIKIVKRTTDS